MQVGDKVKIRTDAFARSTKYIIREMEDLQGCEGVVTQVIDYETTKLYQVHEYCWESCQLIELETTKLDRGDNMDKLINELTLLYLQKNRDYGNSVQVTYDVFGTTSTLTRISDKVNRLKSLRTKEEEVFESIDDTVKDLINYWGIHRSMDSDTKLATFVDTITKFIDSPHYTLDTIQEYLTEDILDNDTLNYITHIINELKDLNA